MKIDSHCRATNSSQPSTLTSSGSWSYTQGTLTPGRRQRRHVLTAAGRIVSGQAAELIKQPPRRKHLEQAVNFPGTELIRGDHQVEALGGQRYEGQAVGQRGRLAGYPRVGQPGRDRGGPLQVPRRLRRITR